MNITRCDSIDDFPNILEENQSNQFNEQEIVDLQEYRSNIRKIRDQILPILISILKDTDNNLNLFELSQQYDKYKNKEQTEQEKQIQCDYILSSVSFSQNKSKINPYTEQKKRESIQISEYNELKQQTKIDIIQLLQGSLNNLQEELIQIKNENEIKKEQIRTYFDNLWTNSSYKQKHHLNAHNYDSKDKQQHYLDIQFSIIPVLEKEHGSLLLNINQQNFEISKLQKETENENDVLEQYQKQRNYITQLQQVREQIELQICQIQEKTEKLKQAQSIMQIENKIDSFYSDLLEQYFSKGTIILQNFQEFINSKKVQFIKQFKGNQSQSMFEQDEFIEDELLQNQIKELQTNSQELIFNNKIKEIQNKVQQKVQQMKQQQNQLEMENQKLISECSLFNQKNYELKLNSSQIFKQNLIKELEDLEKDANKLEIEVNAAKEMSEDLERQKHRYSEKSFIEENNQHKSFRYYLTKFRK